MVNEYLWVTNCNDVWQYVLLAVDLSTCLVVSCLTDFQQTTECNSRANAKSASVKTWVGKNRFGMLLLLQPTHSGCFQRKPKIELFSPGSVWSHWLSNDQSNTGSEKMTTLPSPGTIRGWYGGELEEQEVGTTVRGEETRSRSFRFPSAHYLVIHEGL